MMNQDYEKSFSRNIGVVTKKEQEKIKNTTVAIAGLGGIGGVTVSILARMGVGHFKIADIDTFDIQNINRQAASSHSVLGRNKVDVIHEMIKDINPSATIELFDEGVQADNVDSFLQGVDIVIDAIDYFCFTARDVLQSACDEHGIPVMFSAPLGLTATFLFFTPESMSYNEYFDLNATQDKFDKLIRFTVGIAPSALHLKYMKFEPKRLIQIETGPSLAPSVHLGGSILAVEMLKYITGKKNVIMAPHYLQIDLYKNKIVKKRLHLGNRNPKQQVKRLLAQKLYGKYKSEFLSFIK